MNLINTFSLKDRVVLITGGAGLLGCQHAEAVVSVGGIPILADISSADVRRAAELLSLQLGSKVYACEMDITNITEIKQKKIEINSQYGPVDILINNAANNPKVEDISQSRFSRFETLSLDAWMADLSVGLTGAFLCSQIFGSDMASRGRGVILNIASDLSLISPDQRLYRVAGAPESEQPVKPVTYSVIKTALIGLTRYLATYWADRGVRVNALSPGGVQVQQSDEFVRRLSSLIPLGRMAARSEYQAAIVFLCSDASSYMTGANLVIDGGRTCW